MHLQNFKKGKKIKVILHLLNGIGIKLIPEGDNPYLNVDLVKFTKLNDLKL